METNKTKLLVLSIQSELEELSEKITQLQEFESSAVAYPGLTHTEQHNLHFQLLAMQEYQYALQVRLDYYKNYLTES